MHGEGLERMLEALDAGRPPRLAGDSVVGSLLLIHGLHPEPLEERVQAALDRVRPYMESHGGNVELLGIEDGVARLRLQGSCDGCGASASTLELAVEKALRGDRPRPARHGGRGRGRRRRRSPACRCRWRCRAAGDGDGPAQARRSWIDARRRSRTSRPARCASTDVEGQRMVVANVEGELLAYHDACVACGSSLSTRDRSARACSSCPDCGRRFFLPRAGRSLDDERLQLAPVPLLRERAAAQGWR